MEGPLREHLYERGFRSIECHHVSKLKQRQKRFCNLAIRIETIFIIIIFLTCLDLETLWTKPIGPRNDGAGQVKRDNSFGPKHTSPYLSTRTGTQRCIDYQGMLASIGFFFFFLVVLLKWKISLVSLIYSQSLISGSVVLSRYRFW